MKVPTNLPFFLCCLLLHLHLHNGNAFNITGILTEYPEFSALNNFLSQTNLATRINSYQTITVLAVGSADLAPLSGKPTQVLANILSVHVVLDYFDVPKLQMLPAGTTTLTTLFQTTGLARGQQGFVNVTRLATGAIVFRSAAAGSASNGSNLVRSVFSQPYNVSVLQVSSVIIPPGVDGSEASARAPSPGSGGGAGVPTEAPRSSGGGVHTPATAPLPDRGAFPPAGAPSSGGGPPTPAVAPSGSGGRSPSSTPASGEEPAPSPVATTPVSGPPAAGGPAADVPAAGESPASDSPSAGSALHTGLGGVWVAVGYVVLALAI